MCGIGGVLLYEKNRTGAELEYIRLLIAEIANENEMRGSDATGFVTFSKARASIFKFPVAASDLTKTDSYKTYMQRQFTRATKNVLIHTRASTKGSPKVNDNNHPIESHKYIGVHNGMIWNDDELFEANKLYRQGQVDSEVIFRLLDLQGEKPSERGLVRVAELLTGSFTTAFVPKKHKNQMHIIRNDNPITLAYISSLNIIVFASISYYLTQAIREASKLTGMEIDFNDITFFEPRRLSIMSFDTDENNALEQLHQTAVPFTENVSWGYGDYYFEDNRFFQNGAEGMVEESNIRIMPTIEDILTKYEMSDEDLQALDDYIEFQASKAWSDGWGKGRESLSDEMTHRIGLSYEDGYQEGIDAGFDEGYAFKGNREERDSTDELYDEIILGQETEEDEEERVRLGV